jgi:hypothetical protein
MLSRISQTPSTSLAKTRGIIASESHRMSLSQRLLQLGSSPQEMRREDQNQQPSPTWKWEALVLSVTASQWSGKQPKTKPKRTYRPSLLSSAALLGPLPRVSLANLWPRSRPSPTHTPPSPEIRICPKIMARLS